MLSLWRSLATPSRIIPVVATRYQGSLVFNSKACSQFVAGARAEASVANLKSIKLAVDASTTRNQLHAVVQQHLHVMSSSILVDCVFRYCTIKDNRRRSSTSPRHDPLFEKVAARILRRLSDFDVNDCVQLARLAGKMRLDKSSPLVQGVYTRLKDLLTELDIVHMSFLCSAGRNLVGTSVVTETIDTILPIIFEERVKERLDPTDTRTCLCALQIALSTKVRAETRDLIANAANQFISTISPEAAAVILHSASLRQSRTADFESPELRTSVEQCMRILGKNLSEFNDTSVRKILRAFSDVKLYNKELEDALWSLAPKSTLEDVAALFKMMLSKSSLTIKRADYLKKCLLENLNKPAKVASLVSCELCCHAMAALALQSPEPDGSFQSIGFSLAEVLRQNPRARDRPSAFLHILNSLAVMGVYPERELDLLFSKEYQKGMIDLPHHQLKRFLNLEGCLRLYFGDSCPYELTQELRSLASPRYIKAFDHDLEGALRTAVGGDQYLLEHLEMPLGTRAELAVVMSPDGHPVAVADKQHPLQNLPKGCKVLGFSEMLSKNAYWANSADMKRISFVIYLRLQRAQGICQVILWLDKWKALPHNKKMPFLERTIQEAFREGPTYHRQESDYYL